jgi:ElaB/YqjD/DUF883 family membrane-anchored ribosome-binding protein
MEQAPITKVPSNVQEVPTSAEQALRSIRATMDEYMATATEKAREAAAYADRHVQNNPWTAVGIGFGLGMAFGAMIAMLAARSEHSAIERMR